MNTFFIIKQLFIHSQIDEKALSGDSLFFYVSVILFLKKERFTYVKEYHADVYYNSQTGERVHAAFPDGVIDDVNYDGSIRAFLFLLNNDCCTSIDKSRKFLSDLTDGKLNISKGMISKLSREFALKTEPERRKAI